MTGPRTIVAATDLSASSRHACERAAHLAGAHGATLALVHTLGSTALEDLRRWIGADVQAQDAVRCDAAGRLLSIAADLNQRHGVQVTEHLAGEPDANRGRGRRRARALPRRRPRSTRRRE